MNFKAYDILSTLVPGFLLLLALLRFLDLPFDKDLILPYTAFAFLLGYLVNTLSSWLEGIIEFTWGGKPSTQLLMGKSIWKVRFYESQKVIDLLRLESASNNPSPDELFSIAMRYGNEKDSRVGDLNASYAFSRSLLTCVVLAGVFLLIRNYDDWHYYMAIIPILIAVWLRCKQRGYYYAREVLSNYLKIKTN